MPTTTEPPYALTVDVEQPTGTEIFRGRAYYRLKFSVTSAQSMPTEVFVHIRSTINGDIHDEFQSVAGPLDLVQIPSGSQDTNGYHRLAHIDMLIESITLAEETISVIKQNLQDLVSGLLQLDQLTLTETFTVESE